MSSRAKLVAEAGRQLQIHWQPNEWQLLERGLQAKLSRQARRKRVRRIATFATLAVTCAAWAISAAGWPLADGPAPHEARSGGGPVAERSPSLLRLRDGSQLEASAGADWLERAPAVSGRNQVALEVLRGRLRLSVVPHEPGEFRVQAGNVLVEVVGTVLSVERHDGDVSVSVEHGRAKVTRGAEAPTFLGAGERRFFTAADADPQAPDGSSDVAAAPTAPDLSAASDFPAPAVASGKPAASARSWQALARDGEYGAAYGKLRLDAVADVPGDLLLAADVARLSGHPAQAVAPLRRVTQQHAADPRAPLAAFTLGRVYLEDLSNPRDAAQAFRLTRALQPGGPLMESALAREVEALARAGETQRAKDLAREYLARYPSGSKRKLVQRHADEP